jgi:hypothetical protein
MEPLTLDREVKEDNRKVAAWLLHYPERKREYEQRRELILHSSPAPANGMPRGRRVSDHTGLKGRKLAELKSTERWLALVEEVAERLPWKMQILLRLKREFRIGVKGRPVRLWIALELSEEISERMGKDYSIGPDTVDEWWNRLIGYAARLAAKRGLL